MKNEYTIALPTKTLVVLCGPVGAGKSTFVRDALQRDPNRLIRLLSETHLGTPVENTTSERQTEARSSPYYPNNHICTPCPFACHSPP